MWKWLLLSLAWVGLSYPVYRFLPHWSVVMYGVLTMGGALLLANHLSNKPKPVYTTETEAEQGLNVSQYPGKWQVAKNRVTEREPYLTGTEYWAAVRQYYSELGGE